MSISKFLVKPNVYKNRYNLKRKCYILVKFRLSTQLNSKRNIKPSKKLGITFLRPSAQITFLRPPCIKITFNRPELAKLLFHSPVGRKHFLYFCIVKVSNFSIEGRSNV